MDLYFQALLLLLLLLVPLHLHSQTLIPKTWDHPTLPTIPQTKLQIVQERIQSNQTENLDLGDLGWVRGVREEREKVENQTKNQSRNNSWSLKWSFVLKGVSPDEGKSEPILGKNMTMDLKSLGGKSILIGNESSSLTLMMIMVIMVQIRGQD
jgi:hypothetical protein